MPGECMGVGVNCQGNAGNARNARGTYVSECIVPGECRELPGECKVAGVKCYGKWNAKECQGNVRGRKLPGECKGMPGECTVVGAKYQRNAGECRGMPRKRIGV